MQSNGRALCRIPPHRLKATYWRVKSGVSKSSTGWHLVSFLSQSATDFWFTKLLFLWFVQMVRMVCSSGLFVWFVHKVLLIWAAIEVVSEKSTLFLFSARHFSCNPIASWTFCPHIDRCWSGPTGNRNRLRLWGLFDSSEKARRSQKTFLRKSELKAQISDSANRLCLGEFNWRTNWRTEVLSYYSTKTLSTKRASFRRRDQSVQTWKSLANWIHRETAWHRIASSSWSPRAQAD